MPSIIPTPDYASARYSAGCPAPANITESMVESIRPGAVIVDLAAESGGYCALTLPGEKRDCRGATVCGPLNVPSMMPEHASLMYAKNLFIFLSPMLHDGQLTPDWDDEVIAGSAPDRGRPDQA